MSTARSQHRMVNFQLRMTTGGAEDVSRLLATSDLAALIRMLHVHYLCGCCNKKAVDMHAIRFTWPKNVFGMLFIKALQDAATNEAPLLKWCSFFGCGHKLLQKSSTQLHLLQHNVFRFNYISQNV